MSISREAICACLAGMLALFFFVPSARSDQITSVEEIAEQLVPEKANAALALMPDESRKLLALRSYLRSAAILEERWSWTGDEIAAFQGSEAQKELQREIDAVSAHFAKANPDYEIYVHSKIRSLEDQTQHWNENESVGNSAKELRAAWLASDLEMIDPSDPDAIQRFATWLKGFKPSERAHIAAPGLSLHGRAHAIDFQIMNSGKIIAGTNWDEIDAVWRDGGWEELLRASVTAAGPSFSGPLVSPHEPWHYDYSPKPAIGADR